ncbi:MAG: prepilin-type N-terminal cleavage/methylation domain-containing protein [Verrucomicrobiota bacterium]
MKLKFASFPYTSAKPANHSLSPGPRAEFRRAFTLIEMMVVVAIVGLVAAVGLPSISRALRKEGMRKALGDVQDVFFLAREKAILSQQKTAVVFHPQERSFGLEGAAAGTQSGKTAAATLPDGIEFAMLDIFRQDYAESEWAKVFFNPDGTCDEAVIVLLGKGDREKITLEYATGFPVVSDVDR